MEQQKYMDEERPTNKTFSKLRGKATLKL